MIQTRIQRAWKVLVIALWVAMLGAGVASADDAPDFAGDMDEVADTLPADYTVYLSAPVEGKVGGIVYGDEDVVRYASAGNSWAMHFDGSVAGLPAAADIDAYAYNYVANSFTAFHYMSFDRPVRVPGLGKVDDSDVVLYRTSLLGNTWSMVVDGSVIGLTTDAEDIDAIALHTNDYLLLSTSGNYSLINSSNSLYEGPDEDLLLWSGNSNDIIVTYPGSQFGLAAVAKLHNLDIMLMGDGTTTYFLGVQKANSVSGVTVANHDVVAWRFAGGQPQAHLFWDASSGGFPRIDAFDFRPSN